MDQLRVKDQASCELVRAADRPKGAKSDLNLKGRFMVEVWRKGVRIDEFNFDNGITNEAKNALLNIMFHASTQITAWYIGLISLTGYTALAATDTYDDINQAANGWDEFTSYTDGNNGDNATTRPAFPEDAASGQSITNSTVAIFNVTGSGTVKGLFMCGGSAGSQTKGDHAPGATLWSTALFGSGDVPVQSGDQLKVTYTCSA